MAHGDAPAAGEVWSELEIDPDTERRYHELLESLYRLEFDGEEPHVLKLSREAKGLWVQWYYPIHVVCAWIGNTERIAGKNYLQVTDDYFERPARGSRFLHRFAKCDGRPIGELA